MGGVGPRPVSATVAVSTRLYQVSKLAARGKWLALGRVGHHHPTSVHIACRSIFCGSVVQLYTAPWSACNGFCPCCVVQQEVRLDILVFTFSLEHFRLT